MNKYIPLLCIPLLPFLGCSTTSDMARYKADNGASRRLEKRIDDLSGTISLLVNDGNRLHSDLVEVKTLAKEVQQKTDGLATSIRELEERLDGVVASLKEKAAAAPPQPESNATPDQTPFTEFNKPLEKVISEVRQVAGSEKKDVAASEQTKPSPAECTPAVETQSAGADKGEDVQKETVRLLVENAPKEPEERKTVESPPIQSVPPAHRVLPEENKVVEVPVVKHELANANTAKEQEAAKVPEVVAKIEEKKAESSQTGSETTKQTSEPKADAAVVNLLSEPRAREPYLKEAIGRLAEKVFPDNKGIRWNVISFDHKAHLTHTEAEPLQADLGYPRFKFVVSFKTQENPVIIGTYSFSSGQYTPYFPKKK